MTILAWIFLSLFLFAHLSVVVALSFLSIFGETSSMVKRLRIWWLVIPAVIFWEISLIIFAGWLLLIVICKLILHKITPKEECDGELINSASGSCRCLKCSREFKGYRVYNIQNHTIETDQLRRFKAGWLYRIAGC